MEGREGEGDSYTTNNSPTGRYQIQVHLPLIRPLKDLKGAIGPSKALKGIIRPLRATRP